MLVEDGQWIMQGIDWEDNAKSGSGLIAQKVTDDQSVCSCIDHERHCTKIVLENTAVKHPTKDDFSAVSSIVVHDCYRGRIRFRIRTTL